MKEKKEVFRNEWKYMLSRPEADLIRSRLQPFLKLDPHAGKAGYSIRSLYWDDWKNSAYEQKLMGIYARKKWRIRIYNCSDDKISLERKSKRGSYIYKEAASLSREEVEKLLDSDFRFLTDRRENLCQEFYVACMSELLRPKVIVDYERVPLIMDAGTLRITFDSDVRAAVGAFDLFDPGLPTLPAMGAENVLMEVKYTAFLPELIHKLLAPYGAEFTSYSKYVACYEAAHPITSLTAGISKTQLGWRN